MNAVIGIVMLIVLVGMLFVFCIFPIWAFIHCLGSSDLAGGKKALWAIFIFLTWPLGASFYGFFVSDKKVFKVSALFAVILMMLAQVAAAAGFIPGEAQSRKIFSNFIVQFDQIDVSELSIEQTGSMMQSAVDLQADLKLGMLSSRKDVAINFGPFLESILKDQKVTSQEYDQWINMFNQRSTLNRREFERYVKDLK